MTTTIQSNDFETPETTMAKHLKEQRDAYTRAGFTYEDAMRLIEAEVTARSLPAPVVQSPAYDLTRPIPGPQPYNPMRITCSHEPIVEALVTAAGGIHTDGTGRETIAGVVIPCA